MTLTEFVTARLDEDEAAAELPQEHGWYVVHGHTYQHVARHDPARVLAQVAAMRAIVDLWPDPFGHWNGEQAEAARAVKDMIYRHLATIWRDHPDYDPAWAPEGE